MLPRRPEFVMGWDVGGAHLKASCIDAAGQVRGVFQQPCALWQGLPRLLAALDDVLDRGSPGEPAAHAVTMTGEMADVFPDRSDGVRSLVDVMARRLGSRRLGFYAGEAGWLPASGAKARPRAAASCNWHASACALAERIDHALFIDIGSTTADIVPVVGGRVAALGTSDADRLALGELVYTGVVRTPLMALAQRIRVGASPVPLMAELFATTADVYRVLGWLPEEADQHPAADGGPKTAAASRRRLARMVGCDLRDRPPDVWDGAAAAFADAQLDLLERAAREVIDRSALPDTAPLVAAGVGGFVVERLAHRLGRQVWPYAAALGLGGSTDAHWVSWCAPAVAVALLYREHRT